MKTSIAVLIICSLIILPVVSASASTIDDVKAGNELYEKQQYDKAVEEYSKATDEKFNPDILRFNTGAALYKQGKYEEAINAFTDSLITEDKGLESMANYNIANSQFRLGSEKAKEDLSNAINLYKQSLDHYKRAIELDEANADARYNHELTEKRMKVLMDRQKNQPEQEKEKDEEKNEEGEEGEDQEEGEQQKSSDTDKEQGEDKQETESGQSETDKQEEETGQDTASQEDKADSEENAGAEAEEGEKMTQEEANMLLEAFGEEESLDTLEKRGRAQFRGVLKNW